VSIIGKIIGRTYECRNKAAAFEFHGQEILETPKGVDVSHAPDCRCIGCIPKQPNDELYAKLKADYWR